MRRFLILLFLGVLILSAAPRAQVEVEEVGVLQDALKRAQQAFEAYKFPEAIDTITPALNTFSEWENAGRLQPEDETLYEQSLELRGICEFNLGRLKAAGTDFKRLIQLRPDYPFSRAKAAKVRHFFESIRSKIAGNLLITVTPEDSKVFIDGRLLGSGVPPKVPVLKGLHTVKVLHRGYDPVEEQVNIEVGASTPLLLKLVPNARTIHFFLQPEGAVLYLDGRRAGKAVTKASARGNWSRYAKDNGMAPDRVYVLTLPYASPGKHDIRIARRCYLEKSFTIRITLDTLYNQPGYVKPISLEEKRVELEVISHPSGANVIFDGDEFGTTPLSMKNFCIGEHDVLIEKKGVGAYRATVNVGGGGLFKLDVTLRPTLLWIGMTRGSGVDEKEIKKTDAAIREEIGKLKLFNGTLSLEKNPLLPDTFFAGEISGNVVSSTVKKLCARYRCEGLLAGLLERDPKSGLRIRLVLLVPGLPGRDTFESAVDNADEAPKILEGVDEDPFAVDSLRLFHLADIEGFAGPVFLRDIPGEDAPKVGNVLLAIDGAKAGKAANVVSTLSKLNKAVLRLSRAGQSGFWTWHKGVLQDVLPYSGPSSDYRKKRLLSRQAMLGAESREAAVTAVLNLALADLNLNRAKAALKDIEGLKKEWRNSSIAYVEAVALIRLGRPEEARAPLLEAAGAPQAFLDRLGDILLKPLALDLLKQLPSPPASPAGEGALN